MGYIEELRALIGHKRINLTGSVVIIRNREGQILLQQRAYPHGKWGLPGGLMELGEAAEDTARREVYEETGLRLSALTLLGVYSGSEYLCIAQNGDEFYTVMIAYTTDNYEGEAVVSDHESLTLAWFALDELPENIAKSHKKALTDFWDRERGASAE